MKQILLKRGYVLIATIGLILIGLVGYLFENRIQIRNIDKKVSQVWSFEVDSEGQQVPLKLWYDGTDDIYYLFVPAYAKEEDVSIVLGQGRKLAIDGVSYQEGEHLSGLEFRKNYKAILSGFHKELNFQLVRNGGVATMYLDLASGDMEYLKADRTNVDSGNVLFFTEDGKQDYHGRVEKVKGHGNSSWGLTKKKPLSLTLSEKANLLGLGKGKKWILINNYNESTNTINKLIYDYADKVGLSYSPDCQLVDAYMNGVYYGMYLLSEKNEIEENRVDIEKPTNLSGSSYLVTMDLLDRVKRKGDTYVRTDDEYVLRIESPSKAGETVKEEVLSDFQTIENALHNEDGMDPNTGRSWKELVDLDSWARKYMIEEIFENADGVKLSQYFYRTGNPEDTKIYAGPVWDYNASFGNPHGDLVIQNPNCLMANREWLFIGKYHNWFYFLYHDSEFFERVCELYETEFEPLLIEMTEKTMPELHEKIHDSSEANFLRWFGHNENYTSIDHDFEVMNGFMKERMKFLHRAWVEKVDYCHITVRMYRYAKYLNYAVERGKVFDEGELPIPEKKDDYQDFLGWYDRATKKQFDFSKPVTKDVDLYGGWDGKTVNVKKK